LIQLRLKNEVKTKQTTKKGRSRPPVELLDVLEALEVKAQHLRQLLDHHSLLRLLQALADVAEELVLRVQRLRRAAPQPPRLASRLRIYGEGFRGVSTSYADAEEFVPSGDTPNLIYNFDEISFTSGYLYPIYFILNPRLRELHHS